MERKRPEIQNKSEIPVNIYRGEELIAECKSIQEAARFFKRETDAKRFNWLAIQRDMVRSTVYNQRGNLLLHNGR